MGFLKKLGSILAKVGSVALGISPALSFILPGTTATAAQGALALLADTLNQVVQIIVTTETIGQTTGLTGAQKLDAAAPLVAQVLLQSSALVGKKIQDQAAFTAGVQTFVSGLVAILNSVHEDAATDLTKAA